MSDIYTNPGNYGERFVDIPRLENAGIATMQFSHMNGVTYDMVITERDWYKFAVENNDVTLIETYYDAFDRLVLSCSTPVYSTNDVVGVVAMDILIEDINQEIVSTQIGNEGYAILLDENGRVISSPDMTNDSDKDIFLSDLTDESVDNIIADMKDGKSGLSYIKINDEQSFVAYAPVEKSGWCMAMILPEKEVIKPALDSYDNIMIETEKSSSEIRDIMKLMAVVFVIAFVLIILAVFLLTYNFSSKIAEPIKKLTNDVRIISDGNLNYIAEIHTGDEIELLGNAFNSMTGSLKEYMSNLESVTKDKERIATELNVATTIQESMLPINFPVGDKYNLFAYLHPAKEVGGDFYDFFTTDDGKLWVVIADVSGKGVPAALFMVIAKTLIKNHSQYNITPGEVMEKVNNELCANNEAGIFVTAFVGRYDYDTEILQFANAGHNIPLLYHKNKKYEWLESKPGFVLAGFEDMQFENFEVTMHKEWL